MPAIEAEPGMFAAGLLLASLLAAPLPAGADPPRPVATYVVGVEDLAYYPHYLNEGGVQKGIGSAILDAFCARRGCRFVYRPYPVPRLLNSLLNGDIDFKYPDNKHWRQERKEGYAIVYSEPLDEYTDGILVVPERKGLGLKHFRRLGTVRGFTPWAFHAQIERGEVAVMENSNMQGLLAQALIGRVDGAYINIEVGRYYLKKNPPARSDLVFDDSLPYDRDGYSLSTIKHPKLVAELNRFLAEEGKTVAEIKARFRAEMEAME